jgi:CheY-like chemotaxis protein
MLNVLLLERDGATRAAVKAVLEDHAVGVVSARSTERALELCKTPPLRLDALVLGPSLLEPGLRGFLGRVFSLRPALRVLALTAGNLDPAGGSTMTPLAVCWALESVGCEYSLLDHPWTGPRLHRCLEELLGGWLETSGGETSQKELAQDGLPERNPSPSWLRRGDGSGSSAKDQGADDESAG